MDIIVERANRYTKYTFEGYIPNSKKVYAEVKAEIEDFDKPLDKIKFIEIVIRSTNQAFQEHERNCKKPDECGQEFEHDNLILLLTQELERLGVKINENIFTQEEKLSAEAKLDQIIKDLDYLKMGHEVLLADLTQEINDLRDLLFLGKRNWSHLLMGKVVDMTASGMVSEVVSKGILDNIKDWATLKISNP